VYAVRAEDGVLVWRFHALPDRLICAYEQLESVWPVSGSILIKGDIAYFSAGRNSFLDGGVFLFGLDPLTGSLIHQQRLAGPYDEAGFPIVPDRAITGGMGLEGHKGDILLADDRLLYLRHQAFKSDLTPVDHSQLTSPHLITSHGFTEAVPHHRSFWTLDTTLRYDIPTGAGPVHGDILVRDGVRFYEVRGYKPGRTGPFDPRLEGYRLVAGEISPVTDRETVSQAITTDQTAKAKRARRSDQKKQRPKMQRVFTSQQRWTVPIPLTGKALAKAGNVLFVAGTPVAFPEEDLAKAYEGRMGGVLRAVSTEDGRKLAEYKLDVPPVWDSLAAANGRLILCTTDGGVHCFAGEGNE
jgi:outer membrane protein assembly factor BamB